MIADHGTFVHRGGSYDLGLLFALVKDRTSSPLSVNALRLIEHNTVANGVCGSCKYGPPGWHEQRISQADLSFALLVHVDDLVLDGLHRLEKAARMKLMLLPAIEISDADLAECFISGRKAK